MKKVCVIGLGYIGLPTAAMFANNGIDVIGVDVNENIVNTLNAGEIHIEEPDLKSFVQLAFQNGKIRVKNKPEPSDAFIIAVPTPFRHNDYGLYENKSYKKADMSFVISAAEAVIPILRKGNLVILESTSPPRTTIDLIQPILEQSGLKAHEDFFLVYSPERVLPGKILKELVENARVIGGIDKTSAQLARDLYSTFVQGEIFLTDSTTAEMVKLMENTYRDINIAIANEFSRLADRFNVDIDEAISIANRHPRVKILNPGPGVGGHCISVDPWFFIEEAPDLSYLIWAARQVNDSQPEFFVSLIKRYFGSLEGKRICALGLSFKPNVDDLRESPAIDVVNLLIQEGAIIRAFEPFKPDANISGIQIEPTLNDALFDAEVLIFLVAHDQFIDLNPEHIALITKSRLIFNANPGFKPEPWEKAGFKMLTLGRGRIGEFAE